MSWVGQGSMRVAVAFFLAGMIWSAGAEASSIITLASTDKKLTPSMIAIGEPPAGELGEADPDVVAEDAGNTDQTRLSPSMIALGEPAVTSEKVAAIGDKKRGARRISMPMVIRAGIVGDAFSPAAAPASAQPQAAPPQQPAGTPGAEQPNAGQPAAAAEEPKTASSEAQPATPEATAKPPSPAIQPR